MEPKKRRQDRTKAVLPVRLRGKDSSGQIFEELAHTLDLTVSGVRLGAVKREFQKLEQVTILFRQRKMDFRVVWTKKLKGSNEYQIGLEAVGSEKDAWGLAAAPEPKVREDVVAPAVDPLAVATPATT